MSADFFDSNVLIYLFDRTDDQKYELARGLILHAQETRDASISYRVVQETLNVITTKLAPPAPRAQAKSFLDNTLRPLWHIMPSPELYERSLDIRDRYGYAFYDSLIIAAALEAGCTRLYSEYLQHGQRIEGLTIKNPVRDRGPA